MLKNGMRYLKCFCVISFSSIISNWSMEHRPSLSHLHFSNRFFCYLFVFSFVEFLPVSRKT